MATWLQKLGSWLSKTAKDNTGYFNATGEEKAASAYGTRLTGAQQQMNQYNAEQAQIARDWQEEMYQKYQSPSAMMAQFQDAGLNPALMYGSAGSGSMPSASGVASGTAGCGTGHSGLSELNNTVSQAVSMWQMIAGTKKDLELKDAEISNIGADTDLKKDQSKNYSIVNENLQREYDDAHANIVSTLDNNKVQRALWDADINKTKAETELAELNKISLQMSNDSYERLIDLSVRVQESQISLNKAYEAHNKAEIGKIEEDIENLKVQRKLIVQETAESLERTGKTKNEKLNLAKRYNDYDYYKSLEALDVVASGLSYTDTAMEIGAKTRLREMYQYLVKSAYKNTVPGKK